MGEDPHIQRDQRRIYKEEPQVEDPQIRVQGYGRLEQNEKVAV